MINEPYTELVGFIKYCYYILQVSTLGGSHDTTRPSLEYTYGSRCEGKLEYDRCSGAIWTLQISARDYESGMLKAID